MPQISEAPKLNLVLKEIIYEKQNTLRDFDPMGVTKHSIKKKLDAIGWHGRSMDLLSIAQADEAINLFKKSVLGDADRRNSYINLVDHRSYAIFDIVKILEKSDKRLV